MKRGVKYGIIWLVLMAVIALLTQFGLAFLFSEAALMPALGGYNEKMAFPLSAPADETEEKANGSVLYMRALLSEYESFEESGGLLANAHFDNSGFRESYVFLNPQGEHDFSYGLFVYVYQGSGGDSLSSGVLAHPVGLINLRTLAADAGADALREAVSQHPDAAVRLDAYSVQDYLVTPRQITLLDKSGNTLSQVNFNGTGEEITAQNVFLYNDYSAGNEYTGILCKLRIMQEGEREVDRLAADAAKRLLNGETAGEKASIGFGRRTVVSTYESNGYKMVHVNEVIFRKGVVFYIVLLGAVMTLILLIVFSLRGKKKAAE